MFYKGYLFFYCVLVFLDGGYRFFWLVILIFGGLYWRFEL